MENIEIIVQPVETKISIDVLNANTDIDILVSNNVSVPFTESDPVFTSHVAYGILSGDIINWNTAFGWGDHSLVGYLSSVAFADLTDYPVDAVGVLTNDGVGNLSWAPGGGSEINDLTASVTWTNIPDANVPQTAVTQHQAALSITESQISDLSHFTPTSLLTDYSFTDNSTNWNTAFGWGDHAGLYMAIGQQLAITKTLVAGEFFTSYDSVTGLFTSATPSYFTPTSLLVDYGFTDNSANWDTAFGWGDWAGHTHTLTNITDITALAAELNLLDLAGLTVGWVLSADSATTASWKAPTGGGASQLSDLSDVVSATNTNRFALMANGTTGYVGRALVEADISDLGTYSTDIHANIAALNLVSGTNTGDQTSIVGITGTKAQFDTAVTDGNFMYIGDAPTSHTHPWGDITGTPTTLSGYGISDTKANFNTALSDGTFMYVGDAPTAHTHLLAAGATDVTATATELNLLDLLGLTAGWVLSADTATTASWKAPVGVSDHTLLTNIGTNTHAQIDTHIADSTIHFTQAAISITESQISDLGTYSTDIHGNIAALNLVSGTNTGDQTITLTGDVTGSGTGSFAATIATNVVSNTKLAQVATATIKGRITGGSGDVEDLTAAQVRTVISSAEDTGFAKMHVGTTAPISPATGDLWVDTN